jgi:hypothetical protein
MLSSFVHAALSPYLTAHASDFWYPMDFSCALTASGSRAVRTAEGWDRHGTV